MTGCGRKLISCIVVLVLLAGMLVGQVVAKTSLVPVAVWDPPSVDPDGHPVQVYPMELAEPGGIKTQSESASAATDCGSFWQHPQIAVPAQQVTTSSVWIYYIKYPDVTPPGPEVYVWGQLNLYTRWRWTGGTLIVDYWLKRAGGSLNYVGTVNVLQPAGDQAHAFSNYPPWLKICLFDGDEWGVNVRAATGPVTLSDGLILDIW